MSLTAIETLISQAQQGNDLSREQVIRHYKPFIINSVGHICKRYISWSDEEASLSLIAFNRAIDTYSPHSGKKFISYSYLLIKRELIDYFRREQRRESHLSIDYRMEEEMEYSHIEQKESLNAYQTTLHSTELVEEILELDEQLSKFGIAFEELEHYSPKHKDTRDSLIEMAFEFSQDEVLIQEFLRNKKIPITSFCKKTNYHPKKIEKFRKYIVALIILLLHPEWVHLTGYLQLPSRREG